MGQAAPGRRAWTDLRRVLTLGVALMSLAAPEVVVGPSAQAARRPQPRLVDAGVLVIGDSVAHSAHRVVLRGAARPPGWSVDAYPGRRMTALVRAYGPRISYPAEPRADKIATEHIAVPRPRRRVSTVVIELGTNGADNDLTVGQAAGMYARQIRALRARDIWNRGPRRIVLVTPWRNPTIWAGVADPQTGRTPPPYKWANKSPVYRQAMRQVARNTSHVRLADWYRWAAEHPAHFADGVHPDAGGLRAWRNLVFRAIGTKRR